MHDYRTIKIANLLSYYYQKHVIKYGEKVYEMSGKNLFWSIKNSCEILNKLKSRGFHASNLSTYYFSTLYTALPHNLIKDKLVDTIDRTFQREGSLYIACNNKNAFFTSDAVRNYNLWSCQKVCEALTFLLDNIYIRFDSKLYRQIVGIPMCTNCTPLEADLFCSVMRETSCCPFRRIINLMLLKLSILLLGIWMTY